MFKPAKKFMFSDRMRFLIKYILPVIGVIFFWGIISTLYLLTVDKESCEVTIGILTRVENVEYKTIRRRGRETLHREKHLVINDSKVFVINRDLFKQYELIENKYGIYEASLKKGDTISVFSYQVPAYIFGAGKERIYRIENGNGFVFPEEEFYKDLNRNLKYIIAIFIVICAIYYFFIVRPWLKNRKRIKNA